ncbi:MAG: hypothetical protein TH68_04300, partial [Candidatus Synechococcus spongiarum 142]
NGSNRFFTTLSKAEDSGAATGWTIANGSLTRGRAGGSWQASIRPMMIGIFGDARKPPPQIVSFRPASTSGVEGSSVNLTADVNTDGLQSNSSYSWAFCRRTGDSGGTATYNRNGPDYGLGRSRGDRRQLTNNCAATGSAGKAIRVSENLWINTTDDTIDEPDETVGVRFTVTGIGSTAHDYFTYTIEDNDPTVVTLARASGNTGDLTEGGSGKVEFEVELGRALVAG